ncbi:GNAT family N-acetyltransferase [Streptomyces antibioticus]|uniref:GNAT family N-acetyltransferase n=1 Tax=Streptomyces antibioticus TaxID=1890 RepID=UPI0033ACF2F2
MRGAEQPVLGPVVRGLELRPWRAADAGALVAAAGDPAIRKWNLLTVADLPAAELRIARMSERWRSGTGAVWALAPVDGGDVVGLAGWNDVDLAGGSAEIVYWLLPSARGRGLAVPVVERLTRWAFDDLGLHRLRLCHSVSNEPSCRVASKAGYTYEGTTRGALLHEDGWHDQHLHAVVRGDMWGREHRVAAAVEAARPGWEASRDPDRLQQWLKDHGCHGAEAVLVTRALLGCSLAEAGRAFFSAPCRRAERDFQARLLDALDGDGGGP